MRKQRPRTAQLISALFSRYIDSTIPVYLSLCSFCLERFPLPLGAWDGMRYFIVALPEPSI